MKILSSSLSIYNFKVKEMKGCTDKSSAITFNGQNNLKFK